MALARRSNSLSIPSAVSENRFMSQPFLAKKIFD
jgi:hypothetical protein